MTSPAMALFEAVAARDMKRLTEALKTARDVNELDDERCTPLIRAAADGQLELVKALLQAGAEPSWRDSADETAMLKAAANGHAKVAAVLAPMATADECNMAMSFLAAYGKSHGPEYQYDVTAFQRTVADVAARAANFVGHDDPLRRLERVERAEKKK